MLAIKNLTKEPVDRKLLTDVAKIVLKGENIDKEREISLVFVEPLEIQKLNLKYRNINKATDVLSFQGQGECLGEIVICLKEVKNNLAFVFIHGILHLLGYEHERLEDEQAMQEKTEEYLNKI